MLTDTPLSTPQHGGQAQRQGRSHLRPGSQGHSPIHPAMEGQVEQPQGVLRVRPPADDAAGVVVVAAQRLQRDGFWWAEQEGSLLSPQCPLSPPQLLGDVQPWGGVSCLPAEAVGLCGLGALRWGQSPPDRSTDELVLSTSGTCLGLLQVPQDRDPPHAQVLSPTPGAPGRRGGPGPRHHRHCPALGPLLPALSLPGWAWRGTWLLRPPEDGGSVRREGGQRGLGQPGGRASGATLRNVGREVTMPQPGSPGGQERGDGDMGTGAMPREEEEDGQKK